MNYIEFNAPEGYEPPEGAQVDKPFDALCTLQVKSNGKICLKAIGGLPISQAPEKSTGEGMVEAYKTK